MTPDESRLLGSIDQKLTDMIERFERFEMKAMSDQGFTRCAVHRQQVESLKSQMTWIQRILVGGFGIPIAGGLVYKGVDWIKSLF